MTVSKMEQKTLSGTNLAGMSTTRDRVDNDFYATPENAIRAILDNEKLEGSILEPSAGQGHISRLLKEYYPYSEIVSTDLVQREERFGIQIQGNIDFLTYDFNRKFDNVITNPPFNIATSIIEKALSDVKDGGYVVMLLRLNFFGSQGREEFFSKYIPEWCFVHHIRIGFTDKKDSNGYTIIDKKTGLPKRGSTDSIEYAHYVFRKGIKPDYTKLVII